MSSTVRAIVGAVLRRPLEWADNWLLTRGAVPADVSVCVRCGRPSTGKPYGSGPYGACADLEAELLEAAAEVERILRQGRG